MIKINLALRKQASYVGAGVKGSASSAASFKANFVGVTDSFRSILIPLLIGVFAHFAYEFYIDYANEMMMVDIKAFEEEKIKINTELTRIKGFESVKKDLERTSSTLSSKLELIQKLIQGREFAFKAMVSLSQSMSKDVWVTDVIETEQGWNIKGSGMDVGTVGEFMSRLSQSLYFRDVTLKSSVTEVSAGKSNFELTARRE
jgi:hypothetical protein